MTWKINTPNRGQIKLTKVGETVTIDITNCNSVVFTYMGKNKPIDMEFIEKFSISNVEVMGR